MTTKPQKPTAIVFDFGGVLFDWNPYNLFGKFFNHDRMAIERFMAEVDFRDWNYRLDSGQPFAEVLTSLAQRFPQYAEIFRAYDSDWEDSFSGAIQPTVDVLTKLNQAGQRLFALSNWSVEKFALIRPRYAFLGWFKEIVLSGEVGAAKPDARIFAAFLQRSGLLAGECLFIDDSAANLCAAAGMGFGTLLFQSAPQLEHELRQLGYLNGHHRS